jgi:NADP-dependent 3-hydroxy acid dehydrogenase YdfG
MFPCSVSDEVAVKKVASEVGYWDVLVLNAGYQAEPKPLVEADLAEYWQCFEVRGSVVFPLLSSSP